jgi:tellurite methyltransferase
MSLIDREKWDAKYSAAEVAAREPSAVLLGLSHHLPTAGRALDVAGGAGRNAIWLARRGLDVTIADVSPVGLALAQQRGAECGVTIQTVQVDFEQGTLPAGPFNLIVSICYLWRPLFSQYPRLLAPGGRLAVVQPTRRNLERHDKPPAPFLLEVGELPRLVGELEIVHYEEGWLAEGRHDAALVARQALGEV